MSECALALHEIRKSFFGVEVLHGIDLTFKKGEVHGLVGENGAGKSTLMNVIGGVLSPDSGDMYINDEKYTPVTPRDASKAGIAFIHQEFNMFTNLSIAENLYISNPPFKKSGAIDYKKMSDETSKHLKRFDIEIHPNTIVENLPMGPRQTIEIVKALIFDARIIIFDEPTTSLSNKEKKQLFKNIEKLKNDGVAVIFISHILEDVLELSDRISVMRDGCIVKTFNSNKVEKNELISLMVGRKMDKVYPTIEKDIGDVLLKVENLVAAPSVKGVSLELHRGEILGLFGLMGAGRTEFARALYGVDPITSGTIQLNDTLIHNPTPCTSIDLGAAFITEDRRGEGLLMPKPVEDNIVLVNLNKMTNRLGVVDKIQVENQSDNIINDLKVKVNDKKLQLASNLSGGNQQKVVIGKWLLKSPKLLIMDEPTRGVDVGSKYEIYSLIQSLAKDGSGILFISSEMEELIGICDRILVMKDGKISGEVRKGEFDPNNIMYYALSEDANNE
jgi:ribose transport system ATP-binding protein